MNAFKISIRLQGSGDSECSPVRCRGERSSVADCNEADGIVAMLGEVGKDVICSIASDGFVV